MNSGHSALGAGNRANATIGRAVRLSLVNIGGAIPGLGDMSTYGDPTKFTYCAAENEAANPWQPLHVERGFAPEATTVTVLAAEPPHNVNDHESYTAVGLLTTIVSLEAIFLSLFILTSQNRMSRQAEGREHLDLQINLLAEQESSLTLKLLRRLCERQGIPIEEEIRELEKRTNIRDLIERIDEQVPKR